jgi:flagellar biosynthesis chaperone FliJ
MKRFSFPLERVLEWKQVVSQQEQITLESLRSERDQITESLQCLSDKINDLSRHGHQAESGHELAYSARARAALQKSQRQVEGERAKCEVKIVSQSDKLRVVETERRLVSKLKERTFADWSAAVTRDQEATAADIYLSGWNRR